MSRIFDNPADGTMLWFAHVSVISPIVSAPVFLKGAGALAQGLYPAPGTRVMGDLDLLVEAERLDDACVALNAVGFKAAPGRRPPLPYEQDTRDFHEALQAACDAHGAGYYERYKAWADDYFYIPHRQVHRGVGGIFCDHLECTDVATWEANFAFTQDIGRALLAIFPQLVRRRMAQASAVGMARALYGVQSGL